MPAPSVLRATIVSLALAALAACAGRVRPGSHPTVPRADDGVPRAATPTVPSSPVSAADLAALRARTLLVPVANVRAASLRGSFDAPRDGGGRTHLALDILAPRGTPVLAADDGRVWTVRQNALGGLTVYAVDPDDRFVFYYAHLDRYRDGLFDGMPLLKGDTLGFVGTTGNAPPDAPHLHFQIARIGTDRKWWTGTPIDPLPFLRDVEVAMAGRGRPVAETGDRARGVVVPAIKVRKGPTVPADTLLR